MPTAEQFLSGFDIYKGLVIGKYKLKKINITEFEIVKWNEYGFTIRLKFKPLKDEIYKEDISNFKKKFLNHAGNIKIIRSNSRRPYLCNFMYKEHKIKIRHNNTIIYELEGRASRTSENNVF